MHNDVDAAPPLVASFCIRTPNRGGFRDVQGHRRTPSQSSLIDYDREPGNCDADRPRAWIRGNLHRLGIETADFVLSGGRVAILQVLTSDKR